ncbi:hypothetical protein OEZ85_008885 [Tetradesmus obliquus]|uniref:Hemerythrin-like domain-containing protein n=1 Tax=Tetradesmus obliquus TaxID=3088 RepID=A0ABY8TKQ4_TETOB|nr:hypothetical protein OEZ85_008885 [Tetradesmus obliquus]
MQVSSGAPLEAWQVSSLQRYWRGYIERVMEHHSIEEEHFFPFVEQRARVPLLLSEQHGILHDSLDVCDAAMTNLVATGAVGRDAQLLDACMAPYAELLRQKTEHFAAEEQVGLPLFREHFALKDYQPLQDTINASLSPGHKASFFHAMSSKTRAEFCKVHGVPKLALLLTIMPGVRKFDRTLHKPLLAIIEGSREAHTAGCGCFA